MAESASLRVLSELTTVVADDLRPYQVVELLDTEGNRTELFTRYLTRDGAHWVRHGVFQSFFADGALQSEGVYRHGKEHGPWRDLYQNGVVAAEGSYFHGEHVGTWFYRDPDGHEEEPDHFPPAPGPFN